MAALTFSELMNQLLAMSQTKRPAVAVLFGPREWADFCQLPEVSFHFHCGATLVGAHLFISRRPGIKILTSREDLADMISNRHAQRA